MDALGLGGQDVAKAADARPKVKAPGLPDTIRPAIVRRRERLLSEHLATEARRGTPASRTCRPVTWCGTSGEDTGLVAKAADPQQQWWKGVAVAAALAWLAGIEQTAGYAALVAAIEDAIRAGMAEGEADALASAAARQGAGGLDIAAAFAAAYQRLQGDPGFRSGPRKPSTPSSPGRQRTSAGSSPQMLGTAPANGT